MCKRIFTLKDTVIRVEHVNKLFELKKNIEMILEIA